MQKASRRYAYFGHHKCASTWLQYLVGSLCNKLALSHAVFPTSLSFANNLETHLSKTRLSFPCVTNAEWSQVAPILNDRRAFHVIRDPRDIVVSAYFSHRKSHPDKDWPELAGIRQNLQSCSKTEGLIRTIDNLMELPVAGTKIPLFDSMNDWDYNHPNVLELRYEDIITDPYGYFLKILRFLDLVDEAPFGFSAQFKWITWHMGRQLTNKVPTVLPRWIQPQRLPSPLALQIVQDYSFERIAGGRVKGQENENAHFRKGVAGDWHNHFDAEVSAHFAKRTGALLERLRYA